MRRREFITGLGAAGWPFPVNAQQQTKPVIGVLVVQPLAGSEGKFPEVVEGFRRGLAEVGFSEGRNVTIEHHTANGHPERLPTLAADLVRRRPAAIVAVTAPSAFAAKAATQDIPIIFAVSTDPVELGLVASLNRPGGNLTGVAVPIAVIAEKRFQLLHQAVPAADTIALLSGAADSPFSQAEVRHTQSAARILGLRLLVFNVAIDAEIAPVFATLVEQQVGAIGRSCGS